MAAAAAVGQPAWLPRRRMNAAAPSCRATPCAPHNHLLLSTASATAGARAQARTGTACSRGRRAGRAAHPVVLPCQHKRVPHVVGVHHEQPHNAPGGDGKGGYGWGVGWGEGELTRTCTGRSFAGDSCVFGMQHHHRRPHSNTVRMELPKMNVKARTIEEKVSQAWVTSICVCGGAGATSDGVVVSQPAAAARQTAASGAGLQKQRPQMAALQACWTGAVA